MSKRKIPKLYMDILWGKLINIDDYLTNQEHQKHEWTEVDLDLVMKGLKEALDFAKKVKEGKFHAKF